MFTLNFIVFFILNKLFLNTSFKRNCLQSRNGNKEFFQKFKKTNSLSLSISLLPSPPPPLSLSLLVPKRELLCRNAHKHSGKSGLKTQRALLLAPFAVLAP